MRPGIRFWEVGAGGIGGIGGIERILSGPLLFPRGIGGIGGIGGIKSVKVGLF